MYELDFKIIALKSIYSIKKGILPHYNNFQQKLKETNGHAKENKDILKRKKNQVLYGETNMHSKTIYIIINTSHGHTIQSRYHAFRYNLIPPSIAYTQKSLSLPISVLLQQYINEDKLDLDNSDAYNTIDLIFDQHNDIINWKLCYQTKLNKLTVCMVCDNQYIHNNYRKIPKILNQVMCKIESYFSDDITLMPVYMIQIGCRAAFHEALTNTFSYYVCCCSSSLKIKDQCVNDEINDVLDDDNDDDDHYMMISNTNNKNNA